MMAQISENQDPTPARPAVRTQLLFVVFLWLLLAVACFGQTWLRLNLAPALVLLIDLAIFSIAFIPALVITVAVSRKLWRRRRRLQVACVVAATSVVGATLVATPWTNTFMSTWFTLHRSAFNTIATLSCTQETETVAGVAGVPVVDHHGTFDDCDIPLPEPVRDLAPNVQVHITQIGGQSALYWSAATGPCKEARVFFCPHTYWVHMSGPISGPTFSPVGVAPGFQHFESPPCGQPLGDGWWWTTVRFRPSSNGFFQDHYVCGITYED